MTNTAVVTGTSKGLGSAITKHLLRNGWNVYGISRSPSTLDSMWRPHYTHIETSIEDVDSMLTLSKELPEIDLLINNASVYTRKPFAECTFADIHSIIGVNVIGTMNITRVLLPKMKLNSQIIFINSVAGLKEMPTESIYSASKHAISSFAGSLATELRGKVKVSSIYPGGINTTLWNSSNPYPLGDPKAALAVSDVVDAIELIMRSTNNSEIKSIELNPTIEIG